MKLYFMIGLPTETDEDVIGIAETANRMFSIAKQYYKLTGRPNKHKVISRAVAYHGTPQGALSITGIPPLKEME